MTTLTQEYVREHLDYSPETGELRWRRVKQNRKMGVAVGAVGGAGYLYIGINNRIYAAHRLIWLWWYGYFPENQIDHIDRDRLNNKLSNLREVSQTCNNRNCGMYSNNRSGVTGVCWDKRVGKWMPSIRINNKQACLTHHKDFTEAVAHRLAAEQCLGWEGCDSNSSAYQYMKEFTKLNLNRRNIHDHSNQFKLSLNAHDGNDNGSDEDAPERPNRRVDAGQRV